MENQNLMPFVREDSFGGAGKPIRKIWQNEEWYFSVVDVIEILTDSKDPKRYWSVLKTREFQGTTICSTLKLIASDGRKRTNGKSEALQKVKSIRF